jgi:hypothetical protein
MSCFQKTEGPRALPDYIGIQAERPFVRGVGGTNLLPAAATGAILKETNGQNGAKVK